MSSIIKGVDQIPKRDKKPFAELTYDNKVWEPSIYIDKNKNFKLVFTQN